MNNNEGFSYVSIEMFTDWSLVSPHIRGTSGWRGNFHLPQTKLIIRKPVCFLGNSNSMNQAEFRQEGSVIISAKWELPVFPNFATQQYLCRGSLFYVTVRNISEAFKSTTISEVP